LSESNASGAAAPVAALFRVEAGDPEAADREAAFGGVAGLVETGGISLESLQGLTAPPWDELGDELGDEVGAEAGDEGGPGGGDWFRTVGSVGRSALGEVLGLDGKSISGA
jgi:hypothetical protein